MDQHWATVIVALIAAVQAIALVVLNRKGSQKVDATKDAATTVESAQDILEAELRRQIRIRDDVIALLRSEPGRREGDGA